MTDEATATEGEPLSRDEWRASLSDGTLVGQECASCGRVYATPRSACLECDGRTLVEASLPTTGTVHSVTEIFVAPESHDAPYQLAIVDLGECRMLGRIDGSVDVGDGVTFSETVTSDGQPVPVFAADE